MREFSALFSVLLSKQEKRILSCKRFLFFRSVDGHLCYRLFHERRGFYFFCDRFSGCVLHEKTSELSKEVVIVVRTIKSSDFGAVLKSSEKSWSGSFAKEFLREPFCSR